MTNKNKYKYQKEQIPKDRDQGTKASKIEIAHNPSSQNIKEKIT